MATTSSYGSGATAVTSWTNTANAYDASATTYANPVGAVTTHVLDITGYNFAATVPADAVGITSVVVNVQDYVSATNRFTAPTVRAYDGVTALGSSAFTLTQRSAAGSENATLAGSFTVAAVRSAGFKITYSLPQTSTAGSPVAYFGWANVTVNYTVLVNQAVTAASVTSTGVLTNRRILPKILTSTTAATATVRRAVSRTLLDTVAATSTTTKRVSKTILDSVTTTATRSTGSIILRDLNDVVSTTATLTRSVSKTLTDSVTSTPSISTWKFTSSSSSVRSTRCRRRSPRPRSPCRGP